MFCTSCAGFNASSDRRCANCGARLEGGARRGRASRARVRASWPVVLYLVAALAVVGGSASVVAGAPFRGDGAAASYERAVEAAAAGDYLAARDGFATAGGYRDAEQRRQEMAELLAPYEATYLQGLMAFDAGDFATAIASFLQVTRDLPTYRDVGLLLDQARSARNDELHRQLDAAEAAHNWLDAERALALLVAEDPANTELGERLGTMQREHAPIVFTRGEALYLAGPDGADERLLTDAVAASWPVWNPDRTRIAFVTPSDGMGNDGRRLYVINADGSDLRQIATGPRPNMPPIWSPDGTMIAFTSEGDENRGTADARRVVWIVDVATGRMTDLTSSRLYNATSPTWSPTGDRLAFVNRRGDTDTTTTSGAGLRENAPSPTGEVYILTLATGQLEPVSDGQIPNPWRAAWSPATEELVVYSRADGTSYDRGNIYLLDLSTSRVTAIDIWTEDASLPVWSPDGTRFAYVVRGTSVRVIEPGGSDARYGVNVPLARFISWSPGGDAIIAAAADASHGGVVISLTGSAQPRDSWPVGYSGDGPDAGPPQWAPINPWPVAGPSTVSGTALDGGS